MGTGIDERKIFLLAVPNPHIVANVEKIVEKHFKGVTFIVATDGVATWSKLEDLTPHVLVITRDLELRDAVELVQALLKDRQFDQTAVIFLSHPPSTPKAFATEIISGRVQFIGEAPDEGRFQKSVIRALNHAASKQISDFHLRFLAEGDLLIAEGDKADFVYLVKTGKLVATHKNDPKKAILGTIEPGEFVGEMAYINGEPRSADVRAVSDCELIEIPVGILDEILLRKPAWAKALMGTLVRRLKKANVKKAG